ncbi:unnamed protein product [Chondrus crispus]|uniref:Uncharacterized protein n=1 Tax=Chondrus crispus TaxID=2769 RepID=R7QB50_CHOCR|nr:unnamed protein product [Chondrus crispus]CDF34695.1 unnamed protein product [Chondrus crispus]|eukprot:XP_005714514.1 unnamed protein product [Chondrus crispus]
MTSFTSELHFQPPYHSVVISLSKQNEPYSSTVHIARVISSIHILHSVSIPFPTTTFPFKRTATRSNCIQVLPYHARTSTMSDPNQSDESAKTRPPNPIDMAALDTNSQMAQADCTNCCNDCCGATCLGACLYGCADADCCTNCF